MNPDETREGFGEAGLGEAQSSNPPNDPEMLEDEEGTEEDEISSEGGVEQTGSDADAGPAGSPD